jgi:hypothetical protein
MTHFSGERHTHKTPPWYLSAAMRTEVKARKVFFFEKENQKTFAYCGSHPCSPVGLAAGRNAQKFFASFFQKRRILPLPCLYPRRLLVAARTESTFGLLYASY